MISSALSIDARSGNGSGEEPTRTTIESLDGGTDETFTEATEASTGATDGDIRSEEEKDSSEESDNGKVVTITSVTSGET